MVQRFWLKTTIFSNDCIFSSIFEFSGKRWWIFLIWPYWKIGFMWIFPLAFHLRCIRIMHSFRCSRYIYSNWSLRRYKSVKQLEIFHLIWDFFSINSKKPPTLLQLELQLIYFHGCFWQLLAFLSQWKHVTSIWLVPLFRFSCDLVCEKQTSLENQFPKNVNSFSVLHHWWFHWYGCDGSGDGIFPNICTCANSLGGRRVFATRKVVLSVYGEKYFVYTIWLNSTFNFSDLPRAMGSFTFYRACSVSW